MFCCKSAAKTKHGVNVNPPTSLASLSFSNAGESPCDATRSPLETVAVGTAVVWDEGPAVELISGLLVAEMPSSSFSSSSSSSSSITMHDSSVVISELLWTCCARRAKSRNRNRNSMPPLENEKRKTYRYFTRQVPPFHSKILFNYSLQSRHKSSISNQSDYFHLMYRGIWERVHVFYS